MELDTDFLKKENNIVDIKNLKDRMIFGFKESDTGVLYCFCEFDEIRMNAQDIKEILSQSNIKDILNVFEINFLDYVGHKLLSGQTLFKIKNELDIFFDQLKKTNFTFMIGENQIEICEDILKLKIFIFLNEFGEVVIDFEKNKEQKFYFGEDRTYVLNTDTKKISLISNSVPNKFYKDILVKENNKLPIDKFIELKDLLIEKLKLENEVEIEKSLKDISEKPRVEKNAPMIFEVDNTNYFIKGELKYKIKSESFPVKDYRYLETENNKGLSHEIKTVLENDEIVTYMANPELSEFSLEDLMSEFRIKYIDFDVNPFLVKMPMGQIEMFLKRVVPTISKEYEIVYKNINEMNFKKENISFFLDSDLKKSLNLFEFKLKFKIGEHELTFEEVKKVLEENRRSIKLDNGTTVKIENIKDLYKWFEFLKNFNFKRSEGKHIGDSKAAIELDEFLKSFEQTNLKTNEEYRKLLKELKDKKPIEEITLPTIDGITLRDYQKDGVYWMNFLRKYEFGGILADEMGLGKTLQALTLLAMNRDKKHIILCPKSLLYNWENEIKKYYPFFKVLIVDSNIKKREKLIKMANEYDLIITSYSMLQKDYPLYEQEKLDFEYMILDEAHFVKNMKTMSNKAVRTINVNRKIILSGTPIENNLDELYGTFEIIMPGFLGSKVEFRRNFISKIERNDKISLEILQSKIRPFILRRSKKEVLKELPEKQEQIMINEMTNKQASFYQEVLKRVKLDIEEQVEKEGIQKSRIYILSALLRLRQVCNHPLLIDKTLDNEEEMSGKYEQFKEILREIMESKEKVLVFSQFTKMLDIIEKYLISKKIKYSRLDGQTKNRQQEVDRFNSDDEIQVFLISLKAGGVGLNLTSATNVVIFDPWWNPQVENQAIDRAHRIGQKKQVNVYKFITKNSIEEKILKLQERKGNLFDNVVNDNGGVIKSLEWEDLMELFDE